MKIDLMKLKIGDTVKFRCGGEAVMDYGFHLDNEWFYWERLAWKHNGHHQCGITDTPFDIVEIITKPFNWDDVKPGMAFKVNDISHTKLNKGDTVWYIGNSVQPQFLHCVICTSNIAYTADNLHSAHPICLTRAPEHDL